jgi:fructose 1,6-bisphosphate aldolase/phosphatase
MKSDQCTIHLTSANLGRWLGPQLPDELVHAAREYLGRHDQKHRLRGFWVAVFGDDLHLHLTTYNGDFAAGEDPAAFARQLAVGAALAALTTGAELGLGSSAAKDSPLRFAGPKQEAALDLRHLDYPYTERRAEPIFVAKALNGSWGFFNRALFNLFFNPDKGSGHRIEGNDFVAVVESVADLRAGKASPRGFAFGPAEGNELLALVTDPDDWRLSAVYAVKGRFAEGSLREEPGACVAGGRDPVFVGRCQSGLPAVGEYTQAVGEFYFGPGGDEGGYRVGLVPATFKEAQTPSAADGVAKVVAYAYQSFDHGRIPEGDVVDVFAQNPPETRHLQREAMQLVRHMTTHGEFEPYLNAETAIRRAERMAEQLGKRFEPIPEGSDPLMVAANKRATFTVSDIKADAGGKVGLLFNTSAFIAVGDDGHLLMTHKRGADSNEVHLWAYKIFFRQVWVAEVLGYRWYGLGQDLVGGAAAGKKTEDLAGLTPMFLRLLGEVLPVAEKTRFNELQTAFERWRSGAAEGRTVSTPFAGNVSGQGPGFAELPMPRPAPVGLLAIDKAGPAAFNLPVWEAVRRCRADGTMAQYLKTGSRFGHDRSPARTWTPEPIRRGGGPPTSGRAPASKSPPTSPGRLLS